MNKTVYKIMSVFAAFALTFGGFTSARASSRMAASATYYVSTTGNDASSGTQAQPWKTISKAITASLNGDKIIVSAGNYAAFSFSNRIVECAPARTCIVGNTISLSGNATLRGFVVDGFTTNAGIELYVGNNLAESNEVRNGYQCTAGHVAGDGTCPSYADADGIRFFGDNNILRGNYIHDITYTSSRNNTAKPPHIDCFQTWSDSSTHIPAVNTIIEYNVCDNFSSAPTQGTQGIEMDNAVGTIVRHNIFHVYAKKMDIDEANSNTTILNNVFLGGQIISGITINQYGIFVGTGANTIVQNNLFYDINGGTTPLIYNVASESNNLPTGAAGSRSLIKWVNPMLDINYRPLAGSPVCLANGDFIGLYSCGAAVPTVAPTLALTNTPIVTASVVPSSTPDVILQAFTPTPVNTKTATVTPVAATTTPVPNASPLPVSATPTASPAPVIATVTNVSLPLASATPTASSVPASATPVPASITPVASSVPASATPTASSVPTSLPTKTPVPVLPTSTAQSVQPTSVPQQVNPLPSGTVYDDKDGSFVYSPGWKNVVRKDASGGSYRETTINGSFVTFTFSGQSFSIAYRSGRNFRKIDVYVDGLLVGTINEKGSPVFQKSWDYPGELTSGSHTLKLVFITTSKVNDTSGSIDAVIVR